MKQEKEEGMKDERKERGREKRREEGRKEKRGEGRREEGGGRREEGRKRGRRKEEGGQRKIIPLFIFLVIAYMKADLSPSVCHSSLSQLISYLSLSAINFLNSSRASSCLLLLSSLLLLALPSSLRSSLLNHLGCYYKRTENFKKALQCFKEAIAILKETGEKVGIAMGQMNKCALYSQIGE